MDFYRKILTNLAARILSDSDRNEAELSILVTDDAEIRALNSQFRATDRPTDVLSFSQLEGEGPVSGPELLGDVVISWETAKWQAFERGETLLDEMKRLLVHGVLHLLGYDHEEGEGTASEMKALEERYLDHFEI